MASPKSVIRAALQTGLLGEADARTALAMVDDRNLTSQTYNEALAKPIYERLDAYATLMRLWLSAIEERAR